MKKTAYDEEREARIVKEMDLYEVSVVSMPANAKATFGYAAKSFIDEEEEQRKAKEKPDVVNEKYTLKKFIERVVDHMK